MKKSLFFILMLGLMVISSKAQVALYSFTQSNVMYDTLTTSTVLGTTTTATGTYFYDTTAAGITGSTTIFKGHGFPIGFPFNFNGNTFNRFGVNIDGWISLGQDSVNMQSTLATAPMSTASTAPAIQKNRIAAFGRQVAAQTGSQLSYTTLGTAPNRILVIEWKKFIRSATANGDNLNFKIKLYESNGDVVVEYGTFTYTGNNSTAQVGLRGKVGKDYNVLTSTATTTNGWSGVSEVLNDSSKTVYISNTIVPASGLEYKWSMPVLLDAGISAINSPAAASIVSGSKSVAVTIKNFGLDTLKSTSIGWSVNGIAQTPASWTGSLKTGATSTSDTIGYYTFTTHGMYKIKVWTFAPNSSADGNLANDTLSTTVYVQAYATIPFYESFNGTWVNYLNTRDVPTTYWVNTPATGNNSWRRNDDGASAAWTNANTGVYTPTGVGIAPLYSARFHSGAATNGSTGTLDAYIDFSTVGRKLLKFWHINTSGADTLSVFVSNNGGTSFNLVQKFATAAAWTQHVVNLGMSTAANTIIRFSVTNNTGGAPGQSTDVGLDSVQVYIQPADDAGVTAVLSPKPSICGNANDSIVAVVRNLGANSQTNIPVEAKIITPSGSIILHDTIAGPLATNAADTIKFGYINTTNAGNYNFTIFTQLANDTIHSNDTVHLSFNINSAFSIPHIETYQGSKPLADWNVTNFRYGKDHASSFACMYDSITNNNKTGSAYMSAKTGLVTSKSYLSFDYRIVSGATGNTTPTLLNDSVLVVVSSDCGNTYKTLYAIDASTYDKLTTMKKIVLPLAAYAGTNVIPGFIVKGGTYVMTSYFVDIDSVAISDAAVVNLGNDTTVCKGTSLLLNAGASVQGYTYTYNWSTALHPASIATTQTITADSSANYIVNVNNGFGVTTGDSIIINNYQLPIVSLGPDTTNCLSYIIDAGAAFQTYTWSTGETTQTINVNNSGTYWVAVTNTPGCIAKDTVNVTIIPYPQTDAGNDQTVCYLDTLSLLGASTTNYDSLIWTSSGDGHFTDSTLLHPKYIFGANDILSQSVTLTLTVYGKCGNDYSFTNITITTAPNADAGIDTTICNGNNIQLLATGGNTYTWSPSTGLSDVNIANPIANPTSTITYTVSVTSSCGSATDNVKVTVDNIIAPKLGNDTTLCDGDFVILNAGSGYDSYLWSTGATTQSINFNNSSIGMGTFPVSVEVTKGACSSSDSVNITFTTCLRVVEFSNNISVIAYPNPSNGSTNINVSGLNGEANISIYSLQGQAVYTNKVNGNSTLHIDLTGLSTGVYMIRINNDKVNSLSKLIIQ